MKKAIEDATLSYNKIGSSLDVNYLIFNGIDKKVCKKNRVSPDSIMQLGFQAAYHKLTGKFVGSYESCSTAAFKHGRTETVRPCTTATKVIYTMSDIYTDKVNFKNLMQKIYLKKGS